MKGKHVCCNFSSHPSERFQNASMFYLPLLNAVAKKTNIREKNTGGTPPLPPLRPQVMPVAQSTWLQPPPVPRVGKFTFRQISEPTAIPQHIATLCPCEPITINSVAEQTPSTQLLTVIRTRFNSTCCGGLAQLWAGVRTGKKIV